MGDTLDDALHELANKVRSSLPLVTVLAYLSNQVEVNMSVLWEVPKDGVEQLAIRRSLVLKVQEMKQQVHLWDTARKMKKEANEAEMDED